MRTLGLELRLGSDTQAQLLETVVLAFSSGDERVSDAMPARQKYLDLLPRATTTSCFTASQIRGEGPWRSRAE